MHSRLLSATLVILAVCGAARVGEAADGVQIVQRITGGTTGPLTTQMQIENTRMRTEVADQNGALQVVIFDGQKQILYVVDNARKTYMEITKADLTQLQGQMQAMMSQMQAALEKVPPAQRAQMEALMKGRLGGMGGAPAKIESKRAGTDKVGRWACDKYEVLSNGQKVSDVCTVNPSALGVTVKDFEVTRQLAELAAGIAPQMAAQISVVGTPERQGFAGFPVRTIFYAGANTTTTELVEASRQTFADSLFVVPAGFTKQSMPGIAPAR